MTPVPWSPVLNIVTTQSLVTESEVHRRRSMVLAQTGSRQPRCQVSNSPRCFSAFSDVPILSMGYPPSRRVGAVTGSVLMRRGMESRDRDGRWGVG